LGTTWYARGPAYWLRRIAMSLVMLLVVGLLLPLAYAVMAGLYRASPIALGIGLAVTASTGIWTAVWMWRHWLEDTPRPSRRAVTGAAGGGGVAGVLARAGGGLGIAFLAIGSVLLLAPALVLLVISFFPELPPERRARRRLQESHDRPHD